MIDTARPILFKPEMVKAILEGAKSQTRRTNGLRQINESPDAWEFEGRIIQSANKTDTGKYSFLRKDADDYLYLKCPYGAVGDKLWAKEIWAKGVALMGGETICRLVLEIADVRVERAQDISEDDARAEGVAVPWSAALAATQSSDSAPCVAFKTLWNSIHSKDGLDWEANPCVWVISFKRLEP